MSFSIIVPIYNAAKYLNFALDSIKFQSYQDWECICVDDGSTDDSLSIIKEYARSDKRFKFVSQRNQGVSVARNVGLSMAQGTWILFLDGDDGYYTNALEELNMVSRDTNADIIPYGYEICTDVKIFPKIGTPTYHIYNLDKFYDAYEAFKKTRMLCAWNCCYRRSFVGVNRFDAIPIGEDMIFGTKHFVNAKTAVIVNKSYYQYRKVLNSAIHTVSLKNVLSSIDSFGMWMQIIRKWKYYPLVRRFISNRILSYAVVAQEKIALLPKQDQQQALEHFLNIGTLETKGFFFYHVLFRMRSVLLLRLICSSFFYAKVFMLKIVRKII